MYNNISIKEIYKNFLSVVEILRKKCKNVKYLIFEFDQLPECTMQCSDGKIFFNKFLGFVSSGDYGIYWMAF